MRVLLVIVLGQRICDGDALSNRQTNRLSAKQTVADIGYDVGLQLLSLRQQMRILRLTSRADAADTTS